MKQYDWRVFDNNLELSDFLDYRGDVTLVSVYPRGYDIPATENLVMQRDSAVVAWFYSEAK